MQTGEQTAGYGSLKDVLAIIGVLCLGKVILYILWDVVEGFRAHVWSRLWEKDLVNTYGKWGVVTGCTSGIGEEYALQLAKKGMNIVLVARSQEKLQKVATLIGKEYKVETDIVQVDFSEGQIIYDKVAKHLQDKDIGILVNNVGVALPYPTKFENTTAQDVWNQVNVNVGSAPAMVNLVLPGMLVRRRGAIINIASMAACFPVPIFGVYSACKAFVDYFSQTLEWECRGSGVTVQTIRPGYVSTNMTTFSDHVHTPKLSIPTSSAYVSSALSTLGYSRLSSGYWAHGLQTFLVYNSLSKWFSMRNSEKWNTFLEQDWKRKK